MTRELDRLLWRYEYGRLAPELFEQAIRRAVDAISDCALDLLPHADTIRLWNPDLLQARSDALHGAVRAVNRLEYRAALRQLSAAVKVVAETRALLRSLAAADAAEQTMNAVHAHAAVARLRRLPVVASLGQLVDLSRTHIVKRRYGEAGSLADAAARMASSLLECDGMIGGDVGARLAGLEELCAATRAVAPPDDDPAADGSLGVIRGLFEKRYVRLAERLLRELETQLGARRRFLLHCKGVIGTERARDLVRELSWDGAVDCYWHQAIAQHQEILERQRLRAALTLEALDAAMTAE